MPLGFHELYQVGVPERQVLVSRVVEPINAVRCRRKRTMPKVRSWPMAVLDPELMMVTDRFVALDSCFGHLNEDLPLMPTPFPPMRRAHVASGRLCSNS